VPGTSTARNANRRSIAASWLQHPRAPSGQLAEEVGRFEPRVRRCLVTRVTWDLGRLWHIPSIYEAALEQRMANLEQRKGRQWSTSSLRVLFRQQAFDYYAAAHPWAAHIGAVFFTLVILACLGAVGIALPKHLANRHLRQHGAEVSAIVDRTEVGPYKSGKSSTEKFETTLRYHFTTQDGQRHEGASKVDTLERLLVANGARIAVLYDPANPSESAWRNALEQTWGDFFVLLRIALLASVWLGLSIYRYVRWRSSDNGLSDA
jgi:Protein of unknown function (DUF3592)